MIKRRQKHSKDYNEGYDTGFQLAYKLGYEQGLLDRQNQVYGYLFGVKPKTLVDSQIETILQKKEEEDKI